MKEKNSKYSDAGVNIEAADKAKEGLAALVRGTFTANVAGDFGGFGSAFSLKEIGGPRNLLVSSADGVGTKLKIAFMSQRHDTVGHDLVNHLVNDILCMGARPLFFLDYIGLGSMDGAVVQDIVKGIADGCKENGCALIGGETAQMPGFYQPGEYDLAGFIVGVVDQKVFPRKKNLKAGDVLVGFSSSGLHTNGYSLARKAFFECGHYSLDDIPPGMKNKLGDALLAVHHSYLKALYPYVKNGAFKALAHITGGGFEGNISRILPSGLDAVVETYNWKPPAIFKTIQKLADVNNEEMYRVFNMGIGMVAVIEPKNIPYLRKTMKAPDCEVVPIGILTEGSGKVQVNL